MITIAAIDHVVLRTTRMDEMLHFYSAVLGCAREREMPPEFGLVQLRAGTALIDLVAVDSELGRLGGGPPTETGNNLDHLCLQVETMDEAALAQWLRDHDIEVGEFERRYGAQGFGNSVYIKDPEGNTIELRVRI